jgi:hypothetical protein
MRDCVLKNWQSFGRAERHQEPDAGRGQEAINKYAQNLLGLKMLY